MPPSAQYNRLQANPAARVVAPCPEIAAPCERCPAGGGIDRGIQSMKDSTPVFPDSDIQFLVETVLPERSDKERLVDMVRDDPEFVDAMLGDERLFERVMTDEGILVQITPRLFFHVLLLRTRKDMQGERYTLERRARQKIPVFDTHHVVDLLEDRRVMDYLAGMLASFTRTESFTYPVRVRKGIWYKHRFSDLDVDSLIRLCQSLEEDYRFSLYKRIADVCLFLSGMFPEHLQPASLFAAERPRLGPTRDLEDYEQDGRQFYELAASHQGAAILGLRQVLDTLSESFTLAEKPLTFLSEHYLLTRKHGLFAV